MLIYRMMSPERPTGTDQQLFLCTANLAKFSRAAVISRIRVAARVVSAKASKTQRK
jgi:hypothetical protein